MAESNITRCKFCGSYIDPIERAEDFRYEFNDLSPANIRADLCGNCAIMAIYDQVEGVYFDTCDCCKKEFDLAVEEKLYTAQTDNDVQVVPSLRRLWTGKKVLCAKCAIKSEKRENRFDTP